MRALYLIPSIEEFRLENPKKWSKVFNDWLTTALVKNPNERPTAQQLLQHPFVSKIANSPSYKICLVDLLQKVADVKKQKRITERISLPHVATSQSPANEEEEQSMFQTDESDLKDLVFLEKDGEPDSVRSNLF